MKDTHVYMRGLPIPKEQIVLQQERLGAQPFDESLFRESHKKIACAQVIRKLDFEFNRIIKARGRPLGENEIMQLDIGDGAWVYIPIMLVPPGQADVVILPNKDRPAGLVAWFRRKKIYRSGGFNGKAN